MQGLGRLQFIILGLSLFVTACISPVDYGKIPHSSYVADPRCDPAPISTAAESRGSFYLVTSRLPDCRSDKIRLLNHRGDKVRFGHFGGAEVIDKPNGKTAPAVTVNLSSEQQWWDNLASDMKSRNGRVLLYVHGYRENFASSSKDTMQIARLSEFDGPVIQYSWPSQGQLLKYAVDETNMYWDARNFRNFLTRLARQKWTSEIVLVSHSLGARIILPAVEYVDSNSPSTDSSNISNIILASPDIDTQDFERDIAEEILSARRVRKNRRITVYASAKDRALALSSDIHGYPRLGIPRCFDPFEAAALKDRGLPDRCYAMKPNADMAPEKSGLMIIDTTAVRQGRGHSDYLRSASVCRDFAAMVKGIEPANGRLATHLPHVFTLAATPKGAKPDHMTACHRQAR